MRQKSPLVSAVLRKSLRTADQESDQGAAGHRCLKERRDRVGPDVSSTNLLGEDVHFVGESGCHTQQSDDGPFQVLEQLLPEDCFECSSGRFGEHRGLRHDLPPAISRAVVSSRKNPCSPRSPR